MSRVWRDNDTLRTVSRRKFLKRCGITGAVAVGGLTASATGAAEHEEVIEDFSHGDLEANYTDEGHEIASLDIYELSETAESEPYSLTINEVVEPHHWIRAREGQFESPRPGDTFRYSAWVGEEEWSNMRPYFMFCVENPETDRDGFVIRPNHSEGRFELVRMDGSERFVLASAEFDRTAAHGQWNTVEVDFRDSNEERIFAEYRNESDEVLASIETDPDAAGHVTAHEEGPFGWTLWHDTTAEQPAVFVDSLRRVGDD